LLTAGVTNLGLDFPYGRLQLEGSLAAFSVEESRQGNTDLNGDGDVWDHVLHVYDASTGVT
jgi:hypothetical protein